MVSEDDSWTEFLGVGGISLSEGFLVSFGVGVTVDSLDASFGVGVTEPLGDALVSLETDPLGVDGLETLFGVGGGDLILSGVGVDSYSKGFCNNMF